MNPSAELIRLRNVQKMYPMGAETVFALRTIDLVVRPSEFTAVIGPSGSGKSTLLHILGCLDSPTQGECSFEGTATNGLTDHELAFIRNRRIGFVFQQFHLLPRLTALRNVELPLQYAGLSGRRRKSIAEASLDRVHMSHRLHHRPNELSGGERQRVAIARALVNTPSLLLADEPTGNLDSQVGDEIILLFEELNRQTGVTVLVVTHELSIASRCRRTVELRDGSVLRDSETA